MNNTLDNSLETNFNTAMKLSSGNFDYKRLIEYLKSGNIIERQFAALELKEICSENDAKILVSNLVGQDGKIREAVAHKINELAQMDEYKNFFASETLFKNYFQGLLDINGNICRQMLGLTSIEAFNKYLCKVLPEKIESLLVKIEELEATEKQYVVSKRNFQLYWCLEALYYCVESIDLNAMLPILTKTAEFYDYTIREKTAKILSKISDSRFDLLKSKLLSDENYYVKQKLMYNCI